MLATITRTALGTWQTTKTVTMLRITLARFISPEVTNLTGASSLEQDSYCIFIGIKNAQSRYSRNWKMKFKLSHHGPHVLLVNGVRSWCQKMFKLQQVVQKFIISAIDGPARGENTQRIWRRWFWCHWHPVNQKLPVNILINIIRFSFKKSFWWN